MAIVRSPLRLLTHHAEAVKYVIYFLLIFTALYSVYHYLEAHQLLAGYHSWLAFSVAGVFGFFDSDVQAVNNIILHNGNPSLEIISDCDGLAFVCLIFASVLPFVNRSLASRIVGLAVLIPFILLFNWFRIFILGVVRFYFPDLFELVHLYVFQPVIILVTLICFMVWIIASESPEAVR